MLCVGFVCMTEVSWQHITPNRRMIGCVKRSHRTIGCMKRCDSADTSAFLKSLEVFNYKCSEWPRKKLVRSEKKETLQLFSSRQPRMPSSHWKQQKKTLVLRKTTLYGQIPIVWLHVKFISKHVKLEVFPQTLKFHFMFCNNKKSYFLFTSHSVCS